jgi:hypothetical protein
LGISQEFRTVPLSGKSNLAFLRSNRYDEPSVVISAEEFRRKLRRLNRKTERHQGVQKVKECHGKKN